MPRLITPPADEEARSIDLDALVDWCESPAFDPSCEDGLAAAVLDLFAENPTTDGHCQKTTLSIGGGEKELSR